VTVSFRGFDGRPHTGELVVHQRVARGVGSVFARLYRARFPIEAMRLVTGADLEAHPTGDGNNTAAFAGLGWTWGGTWRSPTDFMHFSATGA
jgi:hypothetical protein